MLTLKKTALGLAALLLASWPVTTQADDAGMTSFQQYCATCHGVDAKGAGPLTDLLTEKVPDLTGLSARNDGVFPMLDVLHIIDGRTGLRGHGGPMPVYGALFDAEVGAGDDFGPILYTRGKILSIAMYLEGIQQ